LPLASTTNGLSQFGFAGVGLRGPGATLAATAVGALEAEADALAIGELADALAEASAVALGKGTSGEVEAEDGVAPLAITSRAGVPTTFASRKARPTPSTAEAPIARARGKRFGGGLATECACPPM
jgi:hypothetical protein